MDKRMRVTGVFVALLLLLTALATTFQSKRQPDILDRILDESAISPMLFGTGYQGNNITIADAEDLLRRTPSYEYLSILSSSQEWIKGLRLGKQILLLMPRPLLECNVATVLDAMNRLSAMSDDTLETFFAKLDEDYSRILKTYDRAAKLEYSFEDYVSFAMETNRKSHLLIKYIFEVPDKELFPWVYDKSGHLTLVPNEKGVPFGNRGSAGSSLERFKFSRLHYKRRPSSAYRS